ncbi:hypothetical protein Q4566_14415 [Tamlana sp. 2_MG-2023]|uniref:hypothetical protein n=1 Tax=unclassified Tamlana TaxID=2614803 RepID=UPI0026E4394D|nr:MULTISPECIES: hypothetical protein [unclassified Tamlana]MDO6761402.1 hypothetical protein [Tamlana sp. 2_MG-2023]MDO6791984.1 hypothetical protein [Tamlana sp. 1_MG-2023]
MKKHLQITSIIIIAICFVFKTHAQDTNYWTQQFGSNSVLMSGAVVGGGDDNTMLYYNPGALGFIDNSSISVNATAYRVENITISNALGQEANFKSRQLGAVPLLAGGMINVKNDNWKVGYGFMAPTNFNFKGIARKEGFFDVIDDSESTGLEETVAESAVSDRLNEILIAFGAARRLNDYWSIGITNLFTVRSQSYNRSLSTYVFMNDAERTLVAANLNENVDYYNARYSAKLGVSYQKERWKAGLTLTTPSINLLGIGSVAANIEANNFKLIDDNRISAVATDRQSELKTIYKSPLSISAGVNYIGTKSHIGISCQYYGSTDMYDIMDVASDTFIRPANVAPQLGADDFMRVQAAAKSVFNVAIGYEYLLKDSLSLFLSARNDMSYFDESLNDERGIKTTISSWDIYHISSGVTIKKNQSNLSLGLLFSTGSTNDYEQKGTLNNPNENDLIKGTTTITEASYGSLGLLLGYTLYFKKF